MSRTAYQLTPEEQLNMGGPVSAAKNEARNGEGGEEGGGYQSLRQKMAAARRALDLKERVKKKIKEKKEQVEGYLKDRLLNFIPFYGPWKVFQAIITGKFKKKIKTIDVIIMLFSNIEIVLIMLGVLALIAMIVSWALNPTQLLKDIFNLGWGAVSALVNLFKGLLSS